MFVYTPCATFLSPPNLGDLGGNKVFNYNGKDLCVHRSLKITLIMNGGLMKKGNFEHLTGEQKAELEALAALPEDQIETDDMPEVRDWSDAKRGLFYRPVKQQITLRHLTEFLNRLTQGEKSIIIEQEGKAIAMTYGLNPNESFSVA
jgi:hypothetical protein